MTTPLVSDWPKCPACGSERWHHFGDFEYKPTGRVVAVAVLRVVAVAVLDEASDKPLMHLAWHVEQGIERQRLIRRECRDCDHQWHEDTGKKNAIRAEQP